VLIVGGGVAGLTLAAKLRQQGREPVVIERSSGYSDTGYAISLYTLGSCVLHGLGVYQEFVSHSVETRRYEMRDHKGAMLQELDLSAIANEIGPLFALSRADLIRVLCKACADVEIRMGTTIETMEQGSDRVRTIFSDVTAGEFDLVVGCDGIHSGIRTRVFGEQPVFDTGWTLWTWWGRDGLIPIDSIREYWGHGFFFGAYPIRGRCMVVVALPNDAVPVHNAPDETVRHAMESALSELSAHAEDVRQALDDARALFRWPMLDVRTRPWYSGRVALCGDAAAAFLPTAGAGASNAIRSAAALADELSKADGGHVPWTLEMYAKRCQRIVERNQSDSRKAARFSFV
jgi:2-polyprenyl-6-methoxyphenol hydroxylase-like FAD-dependent oxidoreductase